MTPSHGQKMAVLYLQVAVISQVLIFVTRSSSWSFVERPGLLLMGAFLAAQLIATLIAVYAKWYFAEIEGMGWGWVVAIWVYALVTYIPLDILKFIIRYTLSGRAWITFWTIRPLLLRRRITEKQRGRHSGQPRKGPYTGFIINV